MICHSKALKYICSKIKTIMRIEIPCGVKTGVVFRLSKKLLPRIAKALSSCYNETKSQLKLVGKCMKKSRKIMIVGLAVSLFILACLLCAAGKEMNWDNGKGRQEAAHDPELPNGDGKEADSQLPNEDGKEAEQNESNEKQNTLTQNEGSEEQNTKIQSESKEEQIQKILLSMTVEEKAAQLFIVTPEALTGYSSVTQAGEATKTAFQEYPVGGLIFFEGNIVSEQQVTQMLNKQQEFSEERIGLPLFTSVDEEGGKVTRIADNDNFDVPSFPNISEIGSGQKTSWAYELGDRIGTYLSRMGFNLDFAPVADVLSNPENTVVKQRSYGSDPQIVSQMVQENLKGLQQHQVFGCVKHFPGHGATKGDTHAGYAYTDKTWEELTDDDIIPFEDSIAWGVKFVMVGHISCPEVTGDDVPASLSPFVIGNLLRSELGYEGIVLTDALNMGAVTDHYTSAQAAVKAILAGNDMILMPLDFKSAYAGILAAIQDGTISQERLDESLTRILRVKLSL